MGIQSFHHDILVDKLFIKETAHHWYQYNLKVISREFGSLKKTVQEGVHLLVFIIYNSQFVSNSRVKGLFYINPTYQAFVTLQPDWLPFNSLGADVVNKRKFKTGKVSNLPHMI